MNEQETTTDIIAWLRRPREGENGYLTAWRDEIADRLKAAHRRERGDAAKLREALLQVIRSMELESGYMCTEKKRLGMHGQTQEDLCKGCRARNDECWTMTLKRECEAALAAPPRNCDRFASAEEAWNAYDEWMESYRAQGKTEPFNEFGWLYAEAQEGGAKC